MVLVAARKQYEGSERNMIAGEKAAVDSKQKIRNRYKGVDPSELEVIPAIATDEVALDQRKLKVAAYVRVSTENDEQTSSYELQVNDFTDRIKANPNWEFVGIYSDEGISGTNLAHRKGMLQMIEDARAGKIDHICKISILLNTSRLISSTISITTITVGSR